MFGFLIRIFLYKNGKMMKVWITTHLIRTFVSHKILGNFIFLYNKNKYICYKSRSRFSVYKNVQKRINLKITIIILFYEESIFVLLLILQTCVINDIKCILIVHIILTQLLILLHQQSLYVFIGINALAVIDTTMRCYKWVFILNSEINAERKHPSFP